MGCGRCAVLWTSAMLLVLQARGLDGGVPSHRRVSKRLSPITAPVQLAKLTAPWPRRGGELGRSVAIDRNVIVIGAPGDVEFKAAGAAGEAHVFVAAGASWRHRQRLTAFDREQGDSFGRSVAISGDTIAVGAEHDAIDGVVAGSVYVFVRDGARWSLERKLIAPDPRAEAHFGHSLALEGDTLVVGTWGADTVYVFDRTGSWWEVSQVIQAQPHQGGNFGHSIALDGDTLVVGAEWRDIPGCFGSGGASIFTRTDGEWTIEQDLTAGDPESDDQFGSAVAVEGDTVAVGACSADSSTNEDGGAVYIFTRVGDGWDEQQKIVPCDDGQEQRFGWSVALSGDRLVVGAPVDSVLGIPGTGACHVFRRVGQSWTPSCVLSASDAASWDLLGEVAFSGHTAILGARHADVDRLYDAGATYVFLIP